jgi:hypothetical protein
VLRRLDCVLAPPRAAILARLEEIKDKPESAIEPILNKLAGQSFHNHSKLDTIENFRYVFDKALEGLFIDRMDKNKDVFAQFMSDPQFRQVVEEYLRRQVYEQIHSGTGMAQTVP